MTATVFDLTEDASEERFLDWLCHHLYATSAVVRDLVDSGSAPSVRAHLSPDGRFCPSKTRLIVSMEDGTILVTDEWAAAARTKNEPRVVHEVLRDFGFSTEERTAADQRAEEEEEDVAFMLGTS